MLSDLCGPTSSQAPANPTHRNEHDECGEYNWFLVAVVVELQKKCEKINNFVTSIVCNYLNRL